MDPMVQGQAFEKNAAAFFSDQADAADRPAPRQSMQDASKVFWGDEDKVKGRQTEKPIPGAAIYQPRVAADCIFATTYAAGQKNAEESLHRIKDEKSETLKGQQKWLPYEEAMKRR